MIKEIKIKCPVCHTEGKEEDFNVAINQFTLPTVAHFIDVGFECINCGHKFGFTSTPEQREELNRFKNIKE